MKLRIARVMSWRPKAWSLAVCSVACLGAPACQPADQPAETSNAGGGEPPGVVVAWVDGDGIGVDEVLAARFRRGGKDREAWLEAAVLDKVVSLEARRRKLHERPEVARALRDARLQAVRREKQILRAALKKEIVTDAEISEQELRKAYQERKGISIEIQPRLRQWSFLSEKKARDAVAGVKGAPSLIPGKATQVGPFSLRSPPPSYAKVARDLKRPGDRAVVEAEGKWLVLELVEYVADAKRPLAQVRDQLRQAVRSDRSEKAFEEQLQELRAGAEVRIDQAVLSDEELWREPR